MFYRISYIESTPNQPQIKNKLRLNINNLGLRNHLYDDRFKIQSQPKVCDDIDISDYFLYTTAY